MLREWRFMYIANEIFNGENLGEVTLNASGSDLQDVVKSDKSVEDLCRFLQTEQRHNFRETCIRGGKNGYS